MVSRQPARVEALEICRRRAVVLVGGNVQHARDRAFGTNECAVIAATTEIAEDVGGRLLGPVGPYQSEGALAHRRCERRPIEEPRVVITVTPGVRTGGARCHQSL